MFNKILVLRVLYSLFQPAHLSHRKKFRRTHFSTYFQISAFPTIRYASEGKAFSNFQIIKFSHFPTHLPCASVGEAFSHYHIFTLQHSNIFKFSNYQIFKLSNYQILPFIASYKIIPAATETLNESKFPAIGMVNSSSAAFRK